MTVKKNVKRFGLMALVCLMVLTACGMGVSAWARASEGKEPYEPESVSLAAKTVEEEPYEPESSSPVAGAKEEEPITCVISYTVAELSMEEMLEKSHLVVRGVLTEVSPAARVDFENGGNSIFTNYTFDVKETYRGKEKDQVVVSEEGGQVGNMEFVCEGGPSFELGKEYVLFLYRPMPGYGLATEEEYYWLVVYDQAVYEVESSADGSAMAVFQNDGAKSSLQTFSNRIKELDQEYPVNYNWEREEMIENMKANLESGFITKEESEQMLAELYQYAKIVEE